jgi:junctophilin
MSAELYVFRNGERPPMSAAQASQAALEARAQQPGRKPQQQGMSQQQRQQSPQPPQMRSQMSYASNGSNASAGQPSMDSVLAAHRTQQQQQYHQQQHTQQQHQQQQQHQLQQQYQQPGNQQQEYGRNERDYELSRPQATRPGSFVQPRPSGEGQRPWIPTSKSPSPGPLGGHHPQQP